MSIFVPATATCEKCGTQAELPLSASINGDRRPDLREQILDGTFQSTTCARCAAKLRLPLHLSYLDIGRGEWILAEGIDLLPQWRIAEEEAQDLFDRTYGHRAPAIARELGAGLRPRLVFGWPALREVLLCDDLGLDAIALELLKLATIRAVPGSPLDDMNELRLAGGNGGQLRLTWLEAASETELLSVSPDRRLHDEIVADPSPWATLRGDLEGRLFVDFRRMMFA